jgi:hypothetical protein
MMASCANCTTTSKYEYKVAASLTINYCDKHLPRFLYSAKKAGLLTPKPVEVVVETPKASKKKAVAEEPTVEETPTEE